ncbi:hypothetical protein [Sulfuriferula plumbiphila]|uniref:hypothetical protein n=1 Tax=Sulfuriferula plumbiphila TaxID=171865 RepID=UPI0011BD55C6|nr:hypothetical protein [Sulfuriferula plumbiphila]
MKVFLDDEGDFDDCIPVVHRTMLSGGDALTACAMQCGHRMDTAGHTALPWCHAKGPAHGGFWLAARAQPYKQAMATEHSLAGDFHILLINPPQSTGLLT